MHHWGIDDTDVSTENLNATLTAFDAVVDARVSQSDGAVYPEVAEALADGHTSIIVRDGVYPGFTISSSQGVNIRAVRRPIFSGGVVASGARFSSKITVQSGWNYLWGLGVNIAGVDDIGINLQWGIHNAVDLCMVAGPGSDVANGSGILLGGDAYDTEIRRCYLSGVGNGIRVSPELTEVFSAPRIVENMIYDVAGHGILLQDFDGTDTQAHRDVNVVGNLVHSAARRWGNGLTVEGRAGGKLTLNSVQYTGTGGQNNDAHGIFVEAPSAIPNCRTSVETNKVITSAGFGIAMSVATSRVAVGGNISVANQAGNYANCQNCPGFVSTGSFGSNVGW